jgi:molybdate transport system ATP-binding protein
MTQPTQAWADEGSALESSDLRIDATTASGSFRVQAKFSAGAGVTALFGPSGSGKSVTLATLAGLLRPTDGVISLGGQTVADAATKLHVPTQARRIGMVFQHSSLIPHRSPLDNVALGVPTGNRATRRAMAQELLDRVHAGHLATSPTSTLSGGEDRPRPSAGR